MQQAKWYDEQNIYDILYYGDIIAHDEELGFVISWNRHSTYNLWTEFALGQFRNVDCRVHDTNDYDLAAAVRTAEDWAAELARGEDD